MPLWWHKKKSTYRTPTREERMKWGFESGNEAARNAAREYCAEMAEVDVRLCPHDGAAHDWVQVTGNTYRCVKCDTVARWKAG